MACGNLHITVGGTELAAGQRINDRYELEERLGRGGMGEVWRARHLALNSYVAIKFLHAASAQQETARKRFVTEAQVTAQLKSRHAVQVFDFGVTDGGQPFLVMELLEGETVGHRLERLGRLPRANAVRFLQQAARALDRAHAMGIVHRDFKPDNLVIVKDDDGRESIKVLDFGIAKLVGDLEAAASSPLPPSSDDTLVDGVDGDGPMSLTATNSVLGTPHYMAPEQIRRDNMGPGIDVWAFGVVAFECLTGVPPFDGTTLIEIFTRIQVGRHLAARELAPELPAEFDDWFEMACSLQPEERFRSATVAARALAVSLESARWEKDRWQKERATPVPPRGGASVFAEDSSSNASLPRGTLATGARLLARRPRELGDTNAPVSRPLPPSELVIIEPPKTPSPPPPTKVDKSRMLNTVRSKRKQEPWVLAAFALGAVVLATGILAWRGLIAGPSSSPAATPAADLLSPVAVPTEIASPLPAGPAAAPRLDAASDAR